jgi:hypothetical protein
MGYEVHITRRQHWLDDDGPSIGLNEWLKVVQSDPEMQHEGPSTEEALAAANSTISPEEPGLAVWKAYSRHGPDTVALFWHYDGHVTASNPDQEILRKVWQLAHRLRAKVQGDDGEIYDRTGQVMDEADAIAAGLLLQPPPWWKFWLRWWPR